MTNSTGTRVLRRVMLAGVLGFAVACTPMIRNHGYIPLPEDLSRVVIGQDTRESVVDIVGPPGTTGVLEGGNLYYVASQFRHYGPFAPEEINRQVMVISFNEAGIVQNIETFGLEDGRIVVLSRRVTESSVRDTTFLRQLLGNVGRLNAADFVGEN